MNYKSIQNDLQITLPPILYKYRSWGDNYHKRLITNAEFYFAHPLSFNDPFDVGIPISYDKLTVNEWKDHIRWTLQYQWDASSKHYSDSDLKNEVDKFIQTKFYKDPKEIKRWKDEQLKSFQDAVGIFSAAAENDNILLWSHYANNHKGFCIGFDSKSLFHCSKGMVGKVSYLPDEEIPPIKLDDKEPMNEYLAQLEYKSPLWSYENEYRYVKIPFNEGQNRINSYPKRILKEFIFGCAMVDENKKEIMSAIKKDPDLNHIKLYQALKSKNIFRLDIIPI